MKTVIKRLGFLAKAGLFAGLLVSGQQALAQDTTAGTPVTNIASVSFRVGGELQQAVDSNDAEFVVDRRVDFDVTQFLGALTDITPGQADAFIEFVLTNESNSALDFNLSTAVTTSGTTLRPGSDSTGETMDTIRIRVAPDPVGGTDPVPDLGDTANTNVVGLPATQSIRIRVYADAPLDLTDGAIPGIELTAVAAEGGTPLVETAGVDRPDEIDNVFVTPDVTVEGGNAIFRQADGFLVSDAAVEATKSAATVFDPITGTSSDAKPIPGAYVQYSFLLENTGSADAEEVTIADSLNLTLVQLRDDAYDSGGGVLVNVDLGDGDFCNAGDAVDDTADGCTYNATNGDLSITLPDPLASTATRTVRFQVVVQ